MVNPKKDFSGSLKKVSNPRPIQKRIKGDQSEKANPTDDKNRIANWREEREKQGQKERQMRLDAAHLEREERLKQAEIERQKRIEEADKDRIKRSEQAKLEAQQRIAEQQEALRLKAAEKLPDAESLKIAKRKLIRNRKTAQMRSTVTFFFFVIFPTLATAIYLFLIATPLYSSEAVFSIHTAKKADTSGLSGILGSSGFSDSLRDSFLAREFILSPVMMKYMEKTEQMQTHFMSNKLDWLSRSHLNKMFGMDSFFNYKRRVNVSIDIQEGILRLFVLARTPQDSVRFSNSLLKRTEKQMNLLSKQINDDQVNLMFQEMQKAEQSLQSTRQSIIDLQIKFGELNPRETVLAVYKSIQALEDRIKETERVRDVQLGSNVRNSPITTRIGAELKVLTDQLIEQKNRLVGENDEKSLNSILAKFEYASITKDIAQKRWELALKSLENSRQDALLQRRYLTVIVPALETQFPDNASKVRLLVFVLFGLLMLNLVFSVFTTAVRMRTR